MANRNFPNSGKLYQFHLMPVRLGCSIVIGSSGAVSSFSGPGIKAVVHTGPGVYRVQLQDNYNSFINFKGTMEANAVTGSAIDPNAGSVGALYQITTVGTTTNWVTAGIPSGITPAVGQCFALAAAPSAGNGRVKLVVPSAISSIQLLGNQNSFLNNQPFQAGSGGFITFVCQAATDAATTTLIPTNPAAGDVIICDIMLNNSSIQ